MQAPDPELEMVRGRQAGRLLDDDLLKEALDTIERDCENSWRNSAYGEGEKREAAYQMLKVVKAFRGHLTTVLETGKMAAKSESDQQDARSQERILRDWDGSPESRPDGLAQP